MSIGRERAPTNAGSNSEVAKQRSRGARRKDEGPLGGRGKRGATLLSGPLGDNFKIDGDVVKSATGSGLVVFFGDELDIFVDLDQRQLRLDLGKCDHCLEPDVHFAREAMLGAPVADHGC